jgi:hypothetical protein
MSKDVGNIFGIPFQSTQEVASAVFNFFDQFRFRKENTWPVRSSLVTGGAITNPGNGYQYHTFTSPGTLVVTSLPATADILIVGGGGGAGAPLGSGGGAGGLVYYTGVTLSITQSFFPVVVGAGGAGATGPGTPGGNTSGSPGADSSFNSIVAKGGGGGWPYGAGDPGTPTYMNGGSGGGGNNGPVLGLTIQAPQNAPYAPSPGFNQYGFPGGYSAGPVGGGGGGAAEAGNTDGQGFGGDGVQLPAFNGPLLSPTVAPVLGPLNGYYAGGGAAGSYLPEGDFRAGGLGGGGDSAPRPGLPLDYGNVGVQYSGGGAASGEYSSLRGGSTASAGGAGLVVVRIYT